MSITLPYRFETNDVWRTILKGAFALNALLAFAIALTGLGRRDARTAIGLVVCELVVLAFTRILVRSQTGSVGTLGPDGVVIERNVLFGVPLPGPAGRYALDRFSAVRVELRSATGRPDVQGTGPHELVWLVGRPETPDVLLARTRDRQGPRVGQELGSLLGLPVEEVGGPTVIQL